MQLEQVTSTNAHVLQNLWPLYQHEVSAFERNLPNQHGLFHDSSEVTTWSEHGQSLAPWWQEPDLLHPYLIRVDDRPAGFNLIASRGRLPKEIDADFVVHEFFVLHPYRGKGVAERAAELGFDRHRGTWEIVTWPSHDAAIRFWRKTLSTYTGAKLSEEERQHHWGQKVVFCFANTNESKRG